MTPEQFKALPDGDLVLTVPETVSNETVWSMQEDLSKAFPDRKVLILPVGWSIAPVNNIVALARIEGKLDAMIAALQEQKKAIPGLLTTHAEGRYNGLRDG